MSTLEALCDALRASRGFAHKRDIPDVVGRLAPALPADVKVGDDCAALPDAASPGGGWLLFAIEGFVDDFVERMPWFAGWCGVMVNASDVYAMGGRPLAVVDALWSETGDRAAELLAGMAEASSRYGIPVVGGHSNQRSARGQLAVAILGRARALLTSFDARPGETLLMAVDLRGRWQEPYPYWNAATEAPGERLRGDLELLPTIAEAGLARAAKDISMAGVLGTALMLLECSGVGATVALDRIPRPPGIDAGDTAALLRWLTAFPSYGFLLSVPPENVAAVRERFAARGLACAPIGEVCAGSQLRLQRGDEDALLWDHAARPFITAAAPSGRQAA